MVEKLEKKQEKVLKAIVQSYIRTGKPVASNKLVNCCGARLSSASIRIIMAELEDMGYIQQPHTSGGRVPTDRGYRFYVNELMKLPRTERKDAKYLSALERINFSDLNNIIKRASEMISEVTHYTSLAFIPNEPICASGDLNVFDQPEFHEIESLKSFFSLLDSKERLGEIFDYYLKKDKLQVVIGKENNFVELKNFSLVTSPCRVADKTVALLAVIGPRRMSYPKVISLLDRTAEVLERALDKIL